MALQEDSGLEYPQQTYIPGCKVRLIIRFEEFKQRAQVVAGMAGKVPPQLLKGIVGKKSPLEPINDPFAPNGVKRFLLIPKGAATPDKQLDPQKIDYSKDGLTHVLGGIIPREATLGINGIRQADTASLSFNFQDLPIDPRAVRACGVELFMGTRTIEDYQAGIAGDGAEGTSSTGENRLRLIPDTYEDAKGRGTRSNRRFQGFVDSWEVEWNENDVPMVRLECRDNTTLVVDQMAPPNLYISVKEPIDKAIATYLSNFNKMAGLTVEYRPGGVPIPKLEEALSKGMYRPQLGPPPGGGGGDLSAWDYITDVCGSIGHTCRLEGANLIVQRVRTFTSSAYPPREGDPFGFGRTLPSGRVLVKRHFIYGRNILSMKIGRKFTMNAMQCVEVRAYSPRRKKAQVARFPLPGDTVYGLTVRPGDVADQKWTVFRVSPVEDEKFLRIYAQGIYEQLNRGEFTVSIKTRNLSSFGGGNLDPDILDMQSGDAFELQVNRDNDQYDNLTQIETMMLVSEKNEKFLIKLGFDPGFAKAYATAYNNVGFQTTFRTKQIGLTWSLDRGIDIEILGVNYLTIKADANLPAGEELLPPNQDKPTPVSQP